MNTKICTKCKKLKVLNEFYKHMYVCKECNSTDCKERYAKKVGKNLNEIRVSSKVINGQYLCRCCRQWKLINCFYSSYWKNSEFASICKECNIWYKRVTRDLIKMEFVLGYGGKCSCCGETKLSLLTIEHIINKEHKLIYTETITLMRKLKELDWPEGHTVLCYNCNLSTRHGNPCVHTKEYEGYEKKLEKFLMNDSRKIKYEYLKDKMLSRK